MVLPKAVRQAPRLSRIFAPQQHRPLLSPKHSDSQSVSSPMASPSQSLDHEQSTDFLLNTPPRSQVALQSPFFFDVRDDMDSDERLDPASDSARRDDAAERSYDFSLVIPGLEDTQDFALLFENATKDSSVNKSDRDEAPLEHAVEPTNAGITLAMPEHELLVKEEGHLEVVHEETETKESVTAMKLSNSASTTTSLPIVEQESLHPTSPASPATSLTKPISTRPSLTIITNPEEYLSDDSGSKPLSNCKPVSVRSCTTDASPSFHDQIQGGNHMSEMTSSGDGALLLDAEHHAVADDDKENGEDDTICLLSDKRISKSSSAEGSNETGSDRENELASSSSTLSRLRLPKLKGSKDSKQSTPGERYDALLSKISSEQKRVDTKHAKLRLSVKSSESEEKPQVDKNSLAAKTHEKNLTKDPVLVFEPPQAKVEKIEASKSVSPEKGYQQLTSPSKESVPSSVPEWAKAGYLQRSRQKRLNRLRKANANKTHHVPEDVSISSSQPLVSMMASCEG